MTNYLKRFFKKDRSNIPWKRKAKSEKLLIECNIPVNNNLPVIEHDDEVAIRGLDEVVNRAMAICLVAVKGEGLEQKDVINVLEDYELEGHLTPDEKKFVFNENASQKDRIQFSWQYECYWVMLWALGFIDQLDYPDKICDVPRAVRLMLDNKREGLISKAKLRSKEEILDQADLIYRYHWAVRDAQIKGSNIPGNLESGVVQERHYALNWLIGYMGQEWDDVSTDT